MMMMIVLIALIVGSAAARFEAGSKEQGCACSGQAGRASEVVVWRMRKGGSGSVQALMESVSRSLGPQCNGSSFGLVPNAATTMHALDSCCVLGDCGGSRFVRSGLVTHAREPIEWRITEYYYAGAGSSLVPPASAKDAADDSDVRLWAAWMAQTDPRLRPTEHCGPVGDPPGYDVRRPLFKGFGQYQPNFMVRQLSGRCGCRSSSYYCSDPRLAPRIVAGGQRPFASTIGLATGLDLERAKSALEAFDAVVPVDALRGGDAAAIRHIFASLGWCPRRLPTTLGSVHFNSSNHLKRVPDCIRRALVAQNKLDIQLYQWIVQRFNNNNNNNTERPVVVESGTTIHKAGGRNKRRIIAGFFPTTTTTVEELARNEALMALRQPRAGHREYSILPTERACVARLGRTGDDAERLCRGSLANATTTTTPWGQSYDNESACCLSLTFVVAFYGADTLNLELGRTALASIRRHNPASRVVLVDNGSPRPELAERLANESGARLIRLPSSRFELGALARAAASERRPSDTHLVLLQHSTGLVASVEPRHLPCPLTALAIPWFRYETKPKFRDSRAGFDGAFWRRKAAHLRPPADSAALGQLVSSRPNDKWQAATNAVVALSSAALDRLTTHNHLLDDPAVLDNCATQKCCCAEQVLGLFAAFLGSPFANASCVHPSTRKLHGGNTH